MASLTYLERPSSGEPEGLLVLHHGRGTDERDLLALADVFDADRRLYVITPRAPLRLQGSPGYHWYLVPRVGYPDPETFQAARSALAELHDELWERTGVSPERTVLGGFSMGTVMSYATALSADRPAPAAIMALSGFVPTVEGWEPQLTGRESTKVLISHGSLDPVIAVDFAREARDLLRGGGLEVDYREFEGGHNIDPRDIPREIDWLQALTSG